jgi:hypothetical protein
MRGPAWSPRRGRLTDFVLTAIHPSEPALGNCPRRSPVFREQLDPACCQHSPAGDQLLRDTFIAPRVLHKRTQARCSLTRYLSSSTPCLVLGSPPRGALSPSLRCAARQHLVQVCFADRATLSRWNTRIKSTWTSRCCPRPFSTCVKHAGAGSSQRSRRSPASSLRLRCARWVLPAPATLSTAPLDRAPPAPACRR